MFRAATLLTAMICGCLASGAHAAPYSAHSMMKSCCTPTAQKEVMFSEASAMGARYIRVDLGIDSIFDLWTAPAPEPDWRGVDDVVRLARRHHLRVLAVVNGTPAHISSCRERWPDGHGHCATTDPRRFGEYVARVVARAPDVFRTVEVWNEPDGAWAFEGTPQQYSDMLRATYGEVKRRFPATTVLIGGAMSLRGRDWYARVMAAGAARSFDVASVHVRGRAATVGRAVRRWRRFFRDHGRRVPLWVTEAGYPSDARMQYDARYAGGEAAQARYLRDALPALVCAGAEQVFVTQRDGWESEYGAGSPFNSEGVLELAESAPYGARRKPAFLAVRRLAASASPRACGRGRCRAAGPAGLPRRRTRPVLSSTRGPRSAPGSGPCRPGREQ
jgi:hypothetical protein